MRQSLEQKVDSYLCLSKRRVFVVAGVSKRLYEGRLLDGKRHGSAVAYVAIVAIKIASYPLFGIPALALKAAFHCAHKRKAVPISAPPAGSAAGKAAAAAAPIAPPPPVFVPAPDSVLPSTAPAGVGGPATSPIAAEPCPTSLKNAMELLQQTDRHDGDFSFSAEMFRPEELVARLRSHASRFANPAVDMQKHLGFIEKRDLPAGTRLYMRGDIHGNLKNVFEDMKMLQAQGLLDANFRCAPNVHLVFIGDFADRGIYSTQVLWLLSLLREENPAQVHLIRGNHEYEMQNWCEAVNRRVKGETNKAVRQDDRFFALLEKRSWADTLERFYETMPLAVYMGAENRDGVREYAMCTHALFEPTMDPFPLLDSGKDGDSLVVPRGITMPVYDLESKPFPFLSRRVRRLAEGENAELRSAVWRVYAVARETWGARKPELDADFRERCQRHADELKVEVVSLDSETINKKWQETLAAMPNLYCWGDVGYDSFLSLGRWTPGTSALARIGGREYELSPADIAAYLAVCGGPRHKVTTIFRGHQGRVTAIAAKKQAVDDSGRPEYVDVGNDKDGNPVQQPVLVPNKVAAPLVVTLDDSKGAVGVSLLMTPAERVSDWQVNVFTRKKLCPGEISYSSSIIKNVGLSETTRMPQIAERL